MVEESSVEVRSDSETIFVGSSAFEAIFFERELTPGVGATETHLAVVDVDVLGVPFAQVDGVAGELDIERRVRIGGYFE